MVDLRGRHGVSGSGILERGLAVFGLRVCDALGRRGLLGGIAGELCRHSADRRADGSKGVGHALRRLLGEARHLLQAFEILLLLGQTKVVLDQGRAGGVIAVPGLHPALQHDLLTLGFKGRQRLGLGRLAEH